MQLQRADYYHQICLLMGPHALREIRGELHSCVAVGGSYNIVYLAVKEQLGNVVAVTALNSCWP